MNTKPGYKCGFCPKTYKEKFNYDRHIVCCEFLHKSNNREQSNEMELVDIPSIKTMYRIIQELAVRLDKVEKENIIMKHQLKHPMKKHKIDILELLNTKSVNNIYPDKTLKDWLTESVLPKVSKYLDNVFASNLLAGIKAVLNDVLTSTDNNNIPIRIFDNKPNMFYVYNKPLVSDDIDSVESWFLISINDFDKHILSRISNQFSIDFNIHWLKPNEEKILTMESYKDKYFQYYKAILGGDCSNSDTRYQRSRQFIYSLIKQNIQSILDTDD